MFGKATQMRVLTAGDRFVAIGFGFALDDPGLEFLGQLMIGPNGIDRRETHRIFTQLSQPDRFASARGFVARQLVTHVNSEVMHDHGNAGGSRSMRAEHGKEWRVTVVGVAGVVEETGLFPLSSADVRLGRKLAHHPAIGRVDGDRFLLDVLALNEGLVPTLSQTAEVMVDVVPLLPIVPVKMSVQGLHVLATADHEGMRAIDVVGSIDVFADSLRRMLAGKQVLPAEVSESPVGRQLLGVLLESLCKVFDEPRVVFKDHVRIDALDQTLLENQTVRSVAAPRTVAGSPLGRRGTPATVDRGKTFGFGQWPRIGELLEPFFESVFASIEVDEETSFDN